MISGSGKFKMAAAKPVICRYWDIIHTTNVSEFLLQLETKCQRLAPHFRGPATQRHFCQYCRRDRKSIFKDGGRQTGSSYISAPRPNSNWRFTAWGENTPLTKVGCKKSLTIRGLKHRGVVDLPSLAVRGVTVKSANGDCQLPILCMFKSL